MLTEKNMEDIYLTMIGQLVAGPWEDKVQNLFGPGMPCDRLYNRVYDLKIRLNKRLGVFDEDPDVELMIDTLLEIGEIQSYEMLLCGWNLAKEKNTKFQEI